MFLGLITYPKLIFVCVAVFLAGFVDSIAGGGGVISLPAYMLTGLDPVAAFACNKTTACFGATLAAGRYIKNKAVNWTAAVPSVIMAILGAWLASLLVLRLDPTVFQKIILFVLPFVAFFLIFKRDFGSVDASADIPRNKVIIVSALIGLTLGFYDGLVGPGTGTFAILAFTSLLKFDLKTAGGTARVFNWASGFGSMVSFLFAGKVIWGIALITAACSLAGNYIAATVSCARLWNTPPAMETPQTEKMPVFFSSAIAAKEIMPPASAYSAENRLPNSSAASAMRVQLMKKAYFSPSRYRQTSTTMFARPSLIPGIAMGSGTRNSI